MKKFREELKLYRGTVKEIMAAPTEDRAIYFAWDTREIYVGNARTKVLYNGGESLTTAQVEEKIEELTSDQLSAIGSLVTQTNVKYMDFSSKVVGIENTVNAFDSKLEDKVTELLNSEEFSSEIVQEYFTTELGNTYFTNTEATTLKGRVTDLETSLNSDFYTKNTLDLYFNIDQGKLSDTNTLGIMTNDVFDTYTDSVLKYHNIENFINTENTPSFSVGNVGTQLENSLPNSGGIFSIDIEAASGEDDNLAGNTLVFKHNDNYAKLGANGIIYKYDVPNQEWNPAIFEGIITEVNGVTTTNNTIEIDADDIDETDTRKWNALLPEDIEVDDDGTIITISGVVNAEGRQTPGNGVEIGENSTSIGYNSYAGATDSVALGALAGVSASADGAIQLGSGVNDTPNTLRVFDSELLNSDGKVPTERIIERFNEISLTIPNDDWTEDGEDVLYTADITGITSTAIVWVSPDPEDYVVYAESEILAISQNTDQLVFKAVEIPGQDVTVNVVWRD